MSGDEIKAIETIYNGHKFRSRLEARWAVFFHALGIPYEYELEGVDLEGVGWYLPDFYLIPQDVWVEIKPANKPFYDPKCAALSRHGQPVLYISGNPWPGEYGIFYYKDGDIVTSHAFHFALGRKTLEELWLYCEGVGAICLNSLDDSDKLPLDDYPEILAAYRYARQARFEHGERGGA